MDWDTAFDKRDKATHRFTIADTRGRLDLTVPIAKPASSRCRWSEIGVSTHGAWWDVHRVALESAYGRTPYFEFYIDRFLPMLSVGVTDRYPRLCDLASAWDEQIADILGLTRDNQREATEHDSRLKEAADLQIPLPSGQSVATRFSAGTLGARPHIQSRPRVTDISQRPRKHII